ncbi:ribonuclease T2-like isoform X2 [Brienomyrus brachyistius]|uniref:ribonuclease T2-like isoform X2 n=1 Tax=Brienomyrus brachyistius TaxID=42636 RepID=UPI0020B1AFE5|nr:ribonuclease T2-like isoform X2 [Brienomyrus brachyistius]
MTTSILLLILLGAPASMFISKEKQLCRWECMNLALQWPGTFCVSVKDIPGCVVPQHVQNWTIHGLWPMHVDKCCECWPIFNSDLEELEPELSQLWPSLIKGRNFTFWRNEWIKHGSCAACKEGMNSPTRILKNSGIEPSCINSYKSDDFRKALAPILSDLHEIQCVRDDEEREVLVQVKIPLYQNFTLGCHQKDQEGFVISSPPLVKSPLRPCPTNSPIFYFPIKHEDPYHPCA